MQYVNNMQLQLDPGQGVVRMTFVQSRPGTRMSQIGISEPDIVSEILADVLMPIVTAQEICTMLQKALNPPVTEEKAD